MRSGPTYTYLPYSSTIRMLYHHPAHILPADPRPRIYPTHPRGITTTPHISYLQTHVHVSILPTSTCGTLLALSKATLDGE